MGAQTKQPERPGRKRLAAWPVVFFLLLAAVLLVAGLVWWQRIALATRVVRGALDRQGLTDVSFRLSRLTPGRVTVENIRMGAAEPVLSVERVDMRFSLLELKRRCLGRVQVSGVRTALQVKDGKPISPVWERLKPVLEAAAKRSVCPAAAAETPFSIWLGTVRDVRVDILSADSLPLTRLTLNADAFAESRGQYRVWGEVLDGDRFRLTAGGTVLADTGAVTLKPELKIGDVGGLMDLARRLVPERAQSWAVFPTNCSLTVQGAIALANWTNVGPFEVGAALGRGSEFAAPSKAAFLRFQSFRLEAAGTPDDMQCRLSAGIAGFRLGPDFEAGQESGRMLGLRGSARFRQTVSNQCVTATLDSDLPGRSLAQVLPRILPLVPVFFSDGGTLRTEAEVSRPLHGAWQGRLGFAAEASRSSAPVSAGRVGAGLVRVEGTVAIDDAKPGLVKTAVTISDGYFFRRTLAVKGGVEAHLTARPPYASASGSFRGHMSESVALPQRRLSFRDGEMPFEGEAVVTGLVSNPVWQIALRLPEFGVSSTSSTARVEGIVGAGASVCYSATRLAVEGDAWVRDVTVQAGPENSREVEGGVSRIAAHFKLPECDRNSVSNAVVDVTLSASNGWARAGTQAVLEDARCDVPFTLSLASGLSFLPQQRLTWQRLEAQGVEVVPDGFSLSTCSNAVEARLGARLAASTLGVSVRARVPLCDPKQSVIRVSVPEAAIMPDDAVAAAVRGRVKDVAFSGRLAAEAEIRFWGTRPHVLGRARVMEGRVRSGEMEVEGLAADVPFESGRSFRTIERPVVTFLHAKAGNVRLDQGRFAFQLSPKELFIDRMEVGWCKGSLNAYSVHLNFADPKDDFVVYADRIDLGEALMMVMPFRGEMEGVLYGRFPVGFDRGHVKLSTGFLYSLPGQGGKLRLEDNAQMLSLLDKSGIKGNVQVPLSKALSNMDFSTFKMELEPKTDGDGTLRLKMVGQSNDKDWPAPVDLNLNLHGPLETLLNMGINASRKK